MPNAFLVSSLFGASECCQKFDASGGQVKPGAPISRVNQRGRAGVSGRRAVVCGEVRQARCAGRYPFRIHPPVWTKWPDLDPPQTRKNWGQVLQYSNATLQDLTPICVTPICAGEISGRTRCSPKRCCRIKMDFFTGTGTQRKRCTHSRCRRDDKRDHRRRNLRDRSKASAGWLLSPACGREEGREGEPFKALNALRYGHKLWKPLSRRYRASLSRSRERGKTSAGWHPSLAISP